MTDDLLSHGDLHAALRRMLQQGLRDRNGEELMGLRDMMQRLRERRKEMLERYDPGGDARQREIVEEVGEQRRQQLNEMPPDLAGKVQSLQEYEWMSDDARQA